MQRGIFAILTSFRNVNVSLPGSDHSMLNEIFLCQIKFKFIKLCIGIINHSYAD